MNKMKVFKIAIAMSAIAVVSLTTPATALATTPVHTEQEPMKKQDKTELAMKDLPAAAQEDINANHADAKFVSAYKMTGEDGAVKYKVLLNSGGKEMKLWYDAEGNPSK